MHAGRWEKACSAFDQLVELPSSDRLERLEAISFTDPELREALDALLNSDAAADSILGRIEPPLEL